MRVALVCQDLASPRLLGTGGDVFSRALTLAEGGHDVLLLSEELCRERCTVVEGRSGLVWRRTRPPRPGHRYFSPAHSYADQVYDSLLELEQDLGAFDVVEVPAASGEGLTLLRAKRLMGQFAETTIVARRAGRWATPSGGQPEVGLAGSVRHCAETYVLAHADLVLDHAASLPHGVPSATPPATTVQPPTVWFLGDPAAVAAAPVVAALESALLVQPDLQVRLAGVEGPDPASALRRLLPGCSDRLLHAAHPLAPFAYDDSEFPATGSHVVLGALGTGSAQAAQLARSRGCVVTVVSGNGAAAPLDDEDAAQVVPGDDPAALAAALLRPVRDPEWAGAMSAGSLAAARRRTGQAGSVGRLVREYDVTRARPHPAGAPRRDEPLVSVVIPLFNQGRFLPDALDSIHKSDYRQVEIVVVDDGSTDPETIWLFDELDGVTKVRQPNGGLAAARNAGINAARGELVLPLDADDQLPPEFLGLAVSSLQRNDELAAVSGYVRNFGLLDFTQVPLGYVRNLSLIVNTWARATSLFRTGALQAVGGYSEVMTAYEDWDLYNRMALAGLECDVLPLDGHLYRRHAESMTFAISAEERSRLSQHLVWQHLDALTAEDVRWLVIALTDFWKTGYEPSASVQLQHTWSAG